MNCYNNITKYGIKSAIVLKKDLIMNQNAMRNI